MLRNLLILLMVSVCAAAATAGDWTEIVTFKGDLRYRHEQIDAEGKEMRSRQRIRARLAIDAAIEENLSLHFRLVSGSDDPLSTNQTLDGAGTTKGLGLDRAYFAWKRADSGISALGGKMKNPFYAPAKQELMWDGDLSPEGLSAHMSHGSNGTTLFANGAGLWIDERPAAKNAALFGAQAGIVQTVGDARLTVGGGFFNYTDLSGALYGDDFFGNSTTTITVPDKADVDVFAVDFNLVEFFAEFAVEAGGTPLLFFADFVINNEADADEQAYLFGVKINKAKKSGSWDLTYNYREVQADALMGALANSDFGGGGTDAKGHMISGSYQVSAKANFALTYFANEVGLESSKDYKRFQADMKFGF